MKNRKWKKKSSLFLCPPPPPPPPQRKKNRVPWVHAASLIGCKNIFCLCTFFTIFGLVWSITNISRAWGTPQHRSLNMLPSPQIEACFVIFPFGPLHSNRHTHPSTPLQIISMEVEPWPNNSNGMKNEVLVGTSRKHIENLGNTLGTWWEHIGNRKKTKKFPCPLFPTSPKKLKREREKKRPAETSPWLDKFSISQTISHHFQPVLITPIINSGCLLTWNSSTTQNHELNICAPYCDTMVVVHIKKGGGTRVPKYHLLENI